MLFQSCCIQNAKSGIFSKRMMSTNPQRQRRTALQHFTKRIPRNKLRNVSHNGGVVSGGLNNFREEGKTNQTLDYNAESHNFIRLLHFIKSNHHQRQQQLNVNVRVGIQSNCEQTKVKEENLSSKEYTGALQEGAELVSSMIQMDGVIKRPVDLLCESGNEVVIGTNVNGSIEQVNKKQVSACNEEPRPFTRRMRTIQPNHCRRQVNLNKCLPSEQTKENEESNRYKEPTCRPLQISGSQAECLKTKTVDMKTDSPFSRFKRTFTRSYKNSTMPTGSNVKGEECDVNKSSRLIPNYFWAANFKLHFVEDQNIF